MFEVYLKAYDIKNEMIDELLKPSSRVPDAILIKKWDEVFLARKSCQCSRY